MNSEIIERLLASFQREDQEADRAAVAAAAASNTVKNIFENPALMNLLAKVAEKNAPSPENRLANILPTKPQSSKPEDNSK